LLVEFEKTKEAAKADKKSKKKDPKFTVDASDFPKGDRQIY